MLKKYYGRFAPMVIMLMPVLAMFFVIALSFAPQPVRADGLISCDGIHCNFNDFMDTVVAIINIGFEFAGLVAVVFIAQAGFYYMEGAESDKKSRAKSTLIQALAGLGLIFGAYLLVNFLFAVLHVTGCFSQWYVFSWPPNPCI